MNIRDLVAAVGVALVGGLFGWAHHYLLEWSVAALLDKKKVFWRLWGLSVLRTGLLAGGLFVGYWLLDMWGFIVFILVFTLVRIVTDLRAKARRKKAQESADTRPPQQ